MLTEHILRMPISPASHAPRRLSEVFLDDVGLSYLRIVWLDYVSIAAVAASALWVYSLPMYYLEHRLIPVHHAAPSNASANSAPVFYGPMELSYPWLKEPLPTWACGVVVVLVPLLIITMFQLKLRSPWDFHAGFTGTLRTAAVSTLIATILKHFIGGFRPHFLDVCKPDFSAIIGQPFFNPSACTASSHAVNRAVQGFPSGHTTSAFASSMFLALYINAKLKAFGDHASDLWAPVAAVTPLLLATLIAGSMYISYQHHAYEIVIGMLLGLLFGVVGYRSAYAAVFDCRYNHVPLAPFGARTRFTYPTYAQATVFPKPATEAQHPIMWDWWTKSEVKAQDQQRALSWLRNMGCLTEAGEETSMLVKLQIKKAWKLDRWKQ